MEPTTASETESIRWRGARRLLADRRLWALAALLAVIVGAWAWWVGTPLTRTRNAAIAAMEARDVRRLLQIADPRERTELGITEEAVTKIMGGILWDSGARRAVDVRPYVSQPDQDRFDYVVTWAREDGRPIMMEHMGIPHFFDHDNRLYSVLSFHRWNGAWRLGVTHAMMDPYIRRIGSPEGFRVYRLTAQKLGIKGYMNEYGLLRPYKDRPPAL